MNFIYWLAVKPPGSTLLKLEGDDSKESVMSTPHRWVAEMHLKDGYRLLGVTTCACPDAMRMNRLDAAERFRREEMGCDGYIAPPKPYVRDLSGGVHSRWAYGRGD